MGLGEKVFTSLTDWAKHVVESVFSWIQPKIIEEMRTKVAEELLAPDQFKSKAVKDFVIALQKDWKGSPDTLGALGDGLLKVVIGKGAQVQLESIINQKIGSDMPISDSMFTQMAIITDITLLSNSLSYLGEFLSFGQLDDLGKQLREYLSFSGLSQVTQFGYGMLFSSAISPLVMKEINAKTLPTIYDETSAIRMQYRKLVTPEEYLSNMQKLGYNQERATKLLTNSWFYPDAQDFIRFSVREVFDPSVVEKYGYDEAFPIDNIIPKAQLPKWIQENIGDEDITLGNAVEYAFLDPEILRMYWRAHWQLPSPTMAYEMLHRDVITADELSDLLRIGDYAPYWIPKMIDISYSPYTRVDSRRMFEAGILDNDGYIRSLRDIGYSEDRAKNLLLWAESRKMAPEKDLTKSMIERAYKQALKDRSWTLSALQGLGYDSVESELIVALIDSQEQADLLEESIDNLRFLYTRDIVDKDAFLKSLDTLGLSESQKTKAIEQADRERSARIRLPTKADLLKWLGQNIISADAFTGRMLALGYLNEDIARYIQSAGVE